MSEMIVLLAIHQIATVIWVGGMAFAYWVLRPASGPLDTPDRLALWHRVFSRFLPLVWGAVLALLGSGYGMVLWPLGGFAGVGHHVHLMAVLGMLMVGLFAHLYFAPWQRFRRAVDAGDTDRAAGQLNAIRLVVAINLGLGILVSVVGSTGRHW